MKKIISTLATTLLLTLPVLSGAMDHGHSSMSGMEGTEKGAKTAGRHGTQIREAKVEGYKFEYYLIDMKEMMKGMDMSKMKSHHLMVYVTRPDGKLVEDAKVGFKVAGPGEEQKVMAMAMSGGYGSDIDFKAKGAYQVAAKVADKDKALIDEFSYSVK